MRYEKKTVILSGKGSGFAVVEKSGNGTKIDIRANLNSASEKRVGIITDKAVFIRELPSTTQPFLSFSVDINDIYNIHIVVFDKELILYGAIGKRMWEANLMSIIRANDKPLAMTSVLPQSSGFGDRELLLSGNVLDNSALNYTNGANNDIVFSGMQYDIYSEGRAYADERISGDNFYSGYDFSKKLSAVDAFLDLPRMVDTVMDEKDIVTGADLKIKNSRNDSCDGKKWVDCCGGSSTQNDSDDGVSAIESCSGSTTQSESGKIDCDDGTVEVGDINGVAEGKVMSDNDGKEKKTDGERNILSQLGIDSAERKRNARPCELIAKYLKRSEREVITPCERGVAVQSLTVVPSVRAVSYFERVRNDIDKLFDISEKDGELSVLMPDMQWVRVDMDNRSVGVGRNDSVLCYAVKGKYQTPSPLGEEAAWLPKVKSEPTGGGYWLIFQDIISGNVLHVA